jgi:hypothetical protein
MHALVAGARVPAEHEVESAEVERASGAALCDMGAAGVSGAAAPAHPGAPLQAAGPSFMSGGRCWFALDVTA